MTSTRAARFRGYEEHGLCPDLQIPDRTLKDEEVNKAMERILKSLEHQFEAKLR